MHPNRAFRHEDREAMLAFVGAIGFAHLFVATDSASMVAHAPLTRDGDRLGFHVARANRVAAHLDGARVLASVTGVEGYISPNWYAAPGDQVPTWNYVAVEAEGIARRLDEAGLIAQLDALAAAHESRAGANPAWTRDKMNPAVFHKMLGAIVGFEIAVDALRGTTKLSQNKRDADRAGVIAGLRAGGNRALADAMAL